YDRRRHDRTEATRPPPGRPRRGQGRPRRVAPDAGPARQAGTPRRRAVVARTHRCRPNLPPSERSPMSNPVPVSVSPIAAHFLLRPRAEQAIILGTACLFALPFSVMAIAAVFGGVGMAALSTFALGLLCGRVGWWLGTKPANVLALLRHRRIDAAREGR